MPSPPIVAVAGATGDLGARIVRALAAEGAQVRALVRPDSDAASPARVEGLGATPVAADPASAADMARALEGVACVVSALNGLAPVILERQGLLLDAAIEAGVPRLVPSDFSEDFTRTTPGRNRNLDLRRAFMARADAAVAGTGTRLTSVLNGAFLDMLGAEMPLIQPRLRRVLYWHSADQPLDFTAKDDVAAFTARAALDPEPTPRVLRVAGDTLSVRGIATILSELECRPWRVLRAGGLPSLGLMIRVSRFVAPGGEDPFPPWQGMAYMRDMFSGEGQLRPLDNARYPGLTFTSVRDHLDRRWGRGAVAA